MYLLGGTCCSAAVSWMLLLVEQSVGADANARNSGWTGGTIVQLWNVSCPTAPQAPPF